MMENSDDMFQNIVENMFPVWFAKDFALSEYLNGKTADTNRTWFTKQVLWTRLAEMESYLRSWIVPYMHSKLLVGTFQSSYRHCTYSEEGHINISRSQNDSWAVSRTWICDETPGMENYTIHGSCFYNDKSDYCFVFSE